MPYKWVEPELYLEYFGVCIFHAYDDDMYDEQLNNWFTTTSDDPDGTWQFDARELTEGNDYSNVAFKKAINREIELQSLKFPKDVGYPFKRGSFDWYVNHPSKFISQLAFVVMNADVENKARLKNIYRHLFESNVSGSWDVIFAGDVVDAPLTLGNRGSSEKSGNYGYGSFFWYLNKSGSFVTYLANMILLADAENIALVKREYPQMIAAHEMDNWNDAPKGFEPIYDARGD